MKKLTAVLIVLIMLFSFVACGDKNDGETTSSTETTIENATEAATKDTAENTTENKTNDKVDSNKDDENDDLLITLYPEQDSEDFNNLKGKIKYIETELFYGADAPTFRFVSARNGVKVKLEAIRWSPIVNDFEPYDKDFETTTEENKIYEFMCFRAETIPEYRLVAEYNGKKAEYYMAMDGKEVVTKLPMRNEKFIPEEITTDTVFYNLCLARAVSELFYKDRTDKYSSDIVYETMAYAVTLNDFELEGEDYINMIGLTSWEADAYLNAMYPTFKGKAPKLPDESSFVVANTGREKYLVMPHAFERFSTNEFYGVKDNEDGTYFVKIRVDDFREGYQLEYCFDVTVKIDANNPFGYVITEVNQCNLPIG